MEEKMFKAIQEQSIEKLKDILAAGADVNAKNPKGKTALQEAVGCYSPEMTQLLVDSGAEVNEHIRKEFDAALLDLMYGEPNYPDFFWDFVDEGIIPKIKSLIIGGANVNLKDTIIDVGYTILHTAAYITDADLIKFLLDRGAIVDAKNAKGETPLHLAADNPWEASKLEVLLEAGADPDAKENSAGFTPLHYLMLIYAGVTVGEERVVEAIKVLKKYNADFYAEDDSGHTVAYYSYRANWEIFQALFDIGGVDVNDIVIRKAIPEQEDPCKCSGQTILHVVCYNNLYQSDRQYERIKYLCKIGADINVLDSKCMSPLQYAITNECLLKKDVRAIKYLLKNNARIDTIGGHNILNLKMTSNHKQGYSLAEYTWKILVEHLAKLNAAGYWLKMTSHHNQGYPIPEYIWKILVEHLAKLNAAGYWLDETTMETLSENRYYSKYFDKCTTELDCLKKTELPLTRVTFFNLLVDKKEKLIHYARNGEAEEEFKKTYLQTNFPIYGFSMYKRFNKAIIIAKSSVILSSCLPSNLNPSHVIIKKILRSFTSEDLRILCKNSPKSS